MTHPRSWILFLTLGLLLWALPALADGGSGTIRDGDKVILIKDAIGLAYPEQGTLAIILYDEPIGSETKERLRKSREFVDTRWVAVLSLHKKPDHKGLPDLGEDLLDVEIRVKSGGGGNPSAETARKSMTNFSVDREQVRFAFHFKKKFKDLLDMEWALDIQAPVLELGDE